jgi:hypothetical protein
MSQRDSKSKKKSVKASRTKSLSTRATATRLFKLHFAALARHLSAVLNDPKTEAALPTNPTFGDEARHG